MKSPLSEKETKGGRKKKQPLDSHPTVTLPASSQKTTIHRHLVAHCHAAHFGAGGSFSARLRFSFHCEFYLQEINIVVRMSAQHPSGQRSGGFQQNGSSCGRLHGAQWLQTHMKHRFSNHWQSCKPLNWMTSPQNSCHLRFLGLDERPESL